MEENSDLKPFSGKNHISDNTTPLEADSSFRRHDKEDPDQSDFRKINVRGKESYQNEQKFCPNSIKTAKYNLVTWMPVSLLFQFKRVANIYFLIITILSFQYFSPKNPYGMAGSFVLVLVLTMLKEGYEDYFRARSDAKVNSMTVTQVTEDWNEEPIVWKDIKVGHILKVMENESFPADLFLIKSSRENGLSFVNTMNLDGETNLKEKVAHDCTRFEPMDANFTPFTLEVDEPNPKMHEWNCNWRRGDTRIVLGPQQILMRGCVLKNTEYVYGLVIYTGKDSKIVLNSKKPPQKTSNIMHMMNRILASVFGIQACICLSFAAASTSWNADNASSHVYLGLSSSTNAGFYVIKVLTFLVAYSHLIPISLYVTLEIIKLTLAKYIGNDLKMYDERADRPAISRTSELIEELGEVDIIFSDKTGTLTCNVMEFKSCYIQGRVYQVDDLDPRKNLYSPETLAQQSVKEFMILLAVCHSVFPCQDIHDKNLIHYQATSPDELALVECAKKGGFELINKQSGSLYINYEKTQEWKILVEIPFSSKRGRMSVIVVDHFSKRLVLMTKGADLKVISRFAVGQDTTELNQTLEDFANKGLRTLVMGSRYVQPSEFEKWLVTWEDLRASNSINKNKLLNAHARLIERDLVFVGASAIEDKLQESVPEAIKSLMSGDIRLWVLTGDKEETAIEIAKSCNLIQKNMKIFNLSDTNEESFKRKLNDLKLMINPIVGIIDATLVINGASLAWALSPEYDDEFFSIARRCRSCICCRVSPGCKADVVALAKRKTDWITLAVGDGANDVSMIQTAHVGVGIIGKEGTQAVQSSDYAIAQFKYLQNLIFFHGRLGYRRISWFICYYFYKNFVIVFTELGFAFLNGFSGQIYYLDLLPQLFNALWTSWPCVFAYATDRDLDYEDCLRHTELYVAGQKRMYFNLKVFWRWIVFAILHALVSFLIPINEFSTVAKDSSGLDSGLWLLSTTSFTIVIHIVTLKLILETTLWHWRAMNVYLVSVLFYFSNLFIIGTVKISVVFEPQAPMIFDDIFGTAKVWLMITIVPFIALIPDFLYQFARMNYFPDPTDIAIRSKHLKQVRSLQVSHDDGA